MAPAYSWAEHAKPHAVLHSAAMLFRAANERRLHIGFTRLLNLAEIIIHLTASNRGFAYLPCILISQCAGGVPPLDTRWQRPSALDLR